MLHTGVTGGLTTGGTCQAARVRPGVRRRTTGSGKVAKTSVHPHVIPPPRPAGTWLREEYCFRSDGWELCRGVGADPPGGGFGTQLIRMFVFPQELGTVPQQLAVAPLIIFSPFVTRCNSAAHDG